MSYYTAAQRNAINQDNRQMSALGISLADELEILRALIAAGAIGITADAWDIDALAKDGGHFAQDADTTSGLTFGYQAGQFHNGLAVVTVSAGTILLSASSTNYLEVNRAGVVSTNTSGFTSGSLPLYTVVTGVSSITTVTNKKPLLTLIGPAGVLGSMLSTDAKTKSIELNLGSVSATAAFCLLCPAHVGKLVKATIATKTAVSANDTDYWTFAMVNKGPAGSGTTAMLAATAANTTQATGGSAMTAYVKRDMTLSGTPANLDTAAGDVLELTITKAASATTMDQCVLRLDFTFET